MKTEHIQHLGEFRALHDKAVIASKSGFSFSCDAEEVAMALELLAELRHEKATGWAISMHGKHYSYIDGGIREKT